MRWCLCPVLLLCNAHQHNAAPGHFRVSQGSPMPWTLSSPQRRTSSSTTTQPKARLGPNSPRPWDPAEERPLGPHLASSLRPWLLHCPLPQPTASCASPAHLRLLHPGLRSLPPCQQGAFLGFESHSPGPCPSAVPWHMFLGHPAAQPRPTALKYLFLPLRCPPRSLSGGTSPRPLGLTLAGVQLPVE